ncbi:NotI family restriction endonuclease [Thiomicrorhabdus xiamenensis]|uniref:Restriction endonuclease type II NotI domain-containing protein n=1 Tax=Thiomicrorhabdus xiamenensis TaxID=2739063 RepID=A0A7D4TA14_9GAMM|nr:NotI family restriction endonuclease [Thiomicrorhabdus xiamenensis]QKI88906.1 hypothetical protein HQN79_04645 [Thiomicrorhabdus xiamenensis]
MASANNIAEIYGISIYNNTADWNNLIEQQQCPYLGRKCLKNRKSEAELTIGTCSVTYGKDKKDVIICPHRLLERRQIFTDCLHLLNSHEPGNELHIVAEVPIPGGNVDYFLVSTRDRKVKDFVAIELQTLDTTGTVWPFRQRFVNSKGILVKPEDLNSKKSFGMNWKMTAKTILVQMHHKIETFEHINKHLVLVVQNHLLDYMASEFSFAHISDNARIGDSMHFHAYQLNEASGKLRLNLVDRKSTDAEGISKCLGLESEARIELTEIIEKLEAKISDSTLMTI